MVFSIFAARRPELPARLTRDQIRDRLYQALADCKDMNAQRVIYKINVAPTPADLWLLRCDLHQCIARVHNQGEATRRINDLLDAFEGWVPSGHLTPI